MAKDIRDCRPALPFALVLVGMLLILLADISRPVAAQKISVAEVITKHLEAVGPAKAPATTRIIAGTSQVIFRTEPAGQAIGKGVLASEGPKNLVGMSFPSPVYPREQFGFDGKNFVAAFVTPGVRSVLGTFLMTNDVIFKYGLMTGALSTAWPLADPNFRNARVEYAGTRKIDGRATHEIKYVPKGGSDLKVSLLFDAETFQHIRTEYERVIVAQLDTRSMTNVQTRERRYKMIEEFSLFKKEGELMLPHIYTIKLTVDTQTGTFVAEWILKLTQFSFNEKIDPAAFTAGAAG